MLANITIKTAILYATIFGMTWSLTNYVVSLLFSYLH